MDEVGLQDSAILLLSIGEEEAANVLRHLEPKEIQKIGETMAHLKNVTRERIEEVLESFREASEGQTSLGMHADAYVRSVLIKAVGAERAGFLLERILQTGETNGIESLKWMDASNVADLIGGEHPQIIASILVHLDREQAAAVLGKLAEATRNDVMYRIATLDGLQPSAMRELNDVLAKVLSAGTDSMRRAPLGGARPAAELLNRLGPAAETSVLDLVREHDADLAAKIEDEMFIFENLLAVDDRGIQSLLREVQSESLIVALKGATPELRDKIFKNMSQRAAEMLRDDLEAKGPVRVSEVEAEQKEILKVARRMADEGQLVLGGKGGDSFV